MSVVKTAVAVAMAKRGINQMELSRRLNMKQPTVSKQLNKARPSWEFVEKVADEFNLKLSELVALGEDD